MQTSLDPEEMVSDESVLLYLILSYYILLSEHGFR